MKIVDAKPINRGEPAGTATAAIAVHEAAGDPHAQYLTAAEGDALFLTPVEADTDYLRLDCTNSPLTGTLETQDVDPNGVGRNIGASERFETIFGNSANFVRPAIGSVGPVAILTGAGDSQNIFGAVENNDSNVGSLATLESAGIGSMALGGSLANGGSAASTAAVRATGNGAFTSGRSLAGNGGVAEIAAIGQGSQAFGYSAAFNSGGVSLIRGSGNGSLASGFILAAGGSGIIEATTRGAFAQGSIFSFFGSAVLRAGAYGSFAQGEVGNAGSILALGSGSFVQGSANGGLIQATSAATGAFVQGRAVSSSIIEGLSPGTFAHGFSDTSGVIRAGTSGAVGRGAFAVGFSSAANPIIASADNSAQFGPGTNGLPDSLQVGSAGLRLKGTTGAPTTPQNGDIWVSAGSVFIRSNGVSIQLAGPGPLTN